MLLALFLHFLLLTSILNAGLEVSFYSRTPMSCMWWLLTGLAVEGEKPFPLVCMFQSLNMAGY